MDQTKRPLHIPPEFALYSEKHGIFDMIKQLMEQVIINKPEDPVAFLIDVLKRDTFDVPHILVLGPPASGKRSISKLVSSKLRIVHLITHTLVQEADVRLRDQVEALLNTNQEVPAALWASILKERLSMYDCEKRGWVLEDFPHTRQQALAIQELGFSPTHTVILDAPDTVLIERAAGKRVDPSTGDVYHTTFDWPSSTDVQNRLEEGKGQSEPEMIKKLVEYHRHTDAIHRCFASSIKVINADQPKADVFSQVLAFLQSRARSNAPQAPRILLLGPTGSGKSVQASLLANKYNLVKVSSGQLIKQAMEQDTKAGLAIKSYVERDMMLPDSLVLHIVRERLCQLDCQIRGWVLTGFPKTREQAEQLEKASLHPNRVFFLEVPCDSVMERLTQRATDPVTGDRYHMLYNPPRTVPIKERLRAHPNDHPQLVQRRMLVFSNLVEELGDFYPQALHVIADQDPHTVFECLESMTVQPLPIVY